MQFAREQDSPSSALRDEAGSGSDSDSATDKAKRIGAYLIQGILALGATGVVKHAVNPYSGAEAAVKIVTKTSTRKRRHAEMEVRFLKMARHENVIKMMHVDEDAKHYYLFTEYYDQGDLYNYIQKHGFFEEDAARHLFKQVLEAVDYCHRRLHICHHDIKLENLVINHSMQLRLIDFGFAIELGSEHGGAGKKLIEVYDSSPAYSPLEILLRRPHDESVDLFGLGVCLFYMLTGKFPFCDPDKTTFDELIQNVQSFQVEFPATMSHGAQDLIASLLARSAERISIPKIRAHEWVTRDSS